MCYTAARGLHGRGGRVARPTAHPCRRGDDRMRRNIPRVVALLALVLAALIGGGTALAAPGSPGAPEATSAAANVCRPNPSPPPGPNLMQVTAPVPGQSVVSPIVATGRAVAFEAQFRI